MEYKLKSGKIVTDEMLEKDAEMFERGEWPEGDWIPVVMGRPPLSSTEESITVTFRMPRSRALACAAIAARHGMTRSQFIREAIDRAIDKEILHQAE